MSNEVSRYECCACKIECYEPPYEAERKDITLKSCGTKATPGGPDWDNMTDEEKCMKWQCVTVFLSITANQKIYRTFDVVGGLPMDILSNEVDVTGSGTAEYGLTQDSWIPLGELCNGAVQDGGSNSLVTRDDDHAATGSSPYDPLDPADCEPKAFLIEQKVYTMSYIGPPPGNVYKMERVRTTWDLESMAGCITGTIIDTGPTTVNTEYGSRSPTANPRRPPFALPPQTLVATHSSVKNETSLALTLTQDSYITYDTYEGVNTHTYTEPVILADGIDAVRELLDAEEEWVPTLTYKFAKTDFTFEQDDESEDLKLCPKSVRGRDIRYRWCINVNDRLEEASFLEVEWKEVFIPDDEGEDEVEINDLAWSWESPGLPVDDDYYCSGWYEISAPTQTGGGGDPLEGETKPRITRWKCMDNQFWQYPED